MPVASEFPITALEGAVGGLLDGPAWVPGSGWLEAAITETGLRDLGASQVKSPSDRGGGRDESGARDGAPPAPRTREGASEGDGRRRREEEGGGAQLSSLPRRNHTGPLRAGPGDLGLRPVLSREGPRADTGPRDRYTRVHAEGQGQLS